MTINHGHWSRYTGENSIRSGIEDALGDQLDYFDVDAIETDYRELIQSRLPDGVVIAGNEFFGPQLDIDLQKILRENVTAEDFWEIASKHEKGNDNA